MLREPCHLSDQDILLVLHGEVSRRRTKQARAHLTACRLCRSRMGELESTIQDFVSLHRGPLSPELPSAVGSRALLKARLAEAAAQTHSSPWPGFLQVPYRAAAYLCLTIVISVLGGKLLLREFQLHLSARAFAQATVPDHNLTPGATRPVSIGDVCSMPHEEVVSDVPDFLRRQVFKEYGIANARPGDYEIDYLIAPGLGGAEDIHNLWPEPTVSSKWNSRDKDELEERLHQLVCDGKVDLPTAQKDIAIDWISAYKKYLGNEKYAARGATVFPHTRAML
jgi:hypothetical protein